MRGEKNLQTAIFIWITIGILTLVIDLITSAFLFVWFTVGALAAAVAALCGLGSMYQIIIFLIVSAIFTAIGYPIARKAIKSTVTKTKTTEQGYIGKEIIIDEEIMDKATIKIEGIYWTVKNQGELIKKGDKAIITGLEGNKILIEKIRGK